MICRAPPSSQERSCRGIHRMRPTPNGKPALTCPVGTVWNGDDRISSGETTIIVPDRRACFSEFAAESDRLEVKVKGQHTGLLYGAYHATDYDGLPMDGVEQVEGG